MAGVAQLVRALDCGSGGRAFDPRHSPQSKRPRIYLGFLLCYEYGLYRRTCGSLKLCLGGAVIEGRGVVLFSLAGRGITAGRALLR